jgi:hypothetical protein
VEKDLPALYFPTEARRVQQWPAGGADSETEIGFTTKTGATRRNEGENTRAQKIERHATIPLEPSANNLRMSILVQNTLERAMGIEPTSEAWGACNKTLKMIWRHLAFRAMALIGNSMEIESS